MFRKKDKRQVPNESIIIESQNPLDLRIEDIRSLAEVIAPCVPNYRLGYAYYPPRSGRVGVTWHEVIRIWLPEVVDSVKHELIGALIAIVTTWARRRFKRKGAPKRPKYIGIYGPDGKVIKSVLIKDDSPDLDSNTENDPEVKRTMPPIQGFFRDLNRK